VRYYITNKTSERRCHAVNILCLRLYSIQNSKMIKHDLELWPITLRNFFSSAHSDDEHDLCQVSLNPSTKYRDITRNRCYRTDRRMTDDRMDDRKTYIYASTACCWRRHKNTRDFTGLLKNSISHSLWPDMGSYLHQNRPSIILRVSYMLQC